MAREFNGTSDKIVYANHLSVFDGADKLSLSGWVYANTVGADYGTWIEQQGVAAGPGNTHGFALLNNSLDETAPFCDVRNGSGAPQGVAPAFTVPNTTWTPFYMVYDGTLTGNANRLKLWIDAASITLTFSDTIPATIGTTNQALRLGVDSNNNLFFQGRLAEIGIWTDADTSRVTDLHTNKYAPSMFPTNLHTYLPLISGDGAVDSKGNAGSPTITGTTEVAHPSGIVYLGAGTSFRVNRLRPRIFAPGLAR